MFYFKEETVNGLQRLVATLQDQSASHGIDSPNFEELNKKLETSEAKMKSLQEENVSLTQVWYTIWLLNYWWLNKV